MSSRKIYDVSEEQKNIALWRDAKRKQLRELYLRDSGHPTKSLLFDTGLYRYAAAKTSVEVHFIPSVTNWLAKVGSLIVLFTFTAWYVKKNKNAQEHLYRTGQVSYADRKYKFS